jgi:Putative binding domain, N-terminal
VPDATAVVVNAAGGSATAVVQTGPVCRWTAVLGSSADSWISVATGTSVGPGTVSLTLQPNRSFSGRTGTLVIRNEKGEVLATQSVTQRAAGCLYSLSPSSRTLGWLGTYDGSGDSPFSVDVHAEPTDCRWTATPSVPWIRIVYNTAAGTGDGTVYVSVAQTNADPVLRVGEVAIAGLSGVNPDAHLGVTQNAR